ncbi:MAG: hypothetical protein ACHQ53_17045 [Polyangiales bacterium]
MRGFGTIGGVFLFASAFASASRAQVQPLDCGGSFSLQGDQLSVTPGDGDEGVALDAPVLVRYAEHTDLDALQASVPETPGDPCAGEIVCVFRDASAAGGSTRVPVAGSVVRVDDHSVAFVADTSFAQHDRYFAQVARPGFDTASRTEIEFQTGSVRDRAPPKLSASTGNVQLEVTTPPSECRAPAGSLRVQMSVPRPTDDTDSGSVEVLLFLTRAAGLSGPVLVDRARTSRTDQTSLQLGFLLDRKQAAQPVCVALRATDGVGRLSREEPQLCFDPLPGRFFASCSVAGAGPGVAWPVAPRGTLVALGLGLACVVLRRRRHARRLAAPNGLDTRTL